MTRINTQSIAAILLTSLVTLLIVVAVGYPLKSEAQNSLTWSNTFNKTLYYAWSDGGDNVEDIGNWAPGLQNPNVSVTYRARMYDNTHGGRLYDGFKVEVGTRIKFVHVAHSDTDIYWFGTGFSNDSPYGHWVENAAKPPNQFCLSQDYLGTFPSYWDTGNQYGAFDVYIPLNVDPPDTALWLGQSTAGLQKISDDVYEVTSPGDIVARFVYRETFGKFFYRYKADWDDPSIDMTAGRCVGNDFAMREDSNLSSAYRLIVPQQILELRLTAVTQNANNRPPNPPIVWGPQRVTLGGTYTYKFRTTDPEGDDIRYFIDWPPRDRVNNEVNARRPLDADDRWTQSGTMQSIEKTWRWDDPDSDGRIRFDVFARDNPTVGVQGESDRTVYVVDVVQPLNVSCQGTPDPALVDQPVRWTASISGGSGGQYVYSWDNGAGSGPMYETSYSNSGDQVVWLSVQEIDDEGDVTNQTEGNVTCAAVEVKAREMSGQVWTDDYTLSEGDGTMVRWWSKDTHSCEVWNGADNARWYTTGGDQWSGALPAGEEYYKLMCRRSAGESLELVWQSPTITVTAPDPFGYIRANGSLGSITIPSDTSANITWTSNDANYCEVHRDGVANGWTGIANSSGENTTAVTGPATNVYSLHCSSPTAGIREVNSVSVVTDTPPPDPFGYIRANGSLGSITIPSDTSANITWTSNDANYCEVHRDGVANGWTGIANSSGENTTAVTGPATNVYSLHCSSPTAGIREVNSVSVVTDTPPVVMCTPIDLITSSDYILLGDTMRLTWSVASGCNISSCTITGSGITGGSMTLPNETGWVDVTPTGSATYTLDCGPGGIATTTVEVEQSGQES